MSKKLTDIEKAARALARHFRKQYKLLQTHNIMTSKKYNPHTACSTFAYLVNLPAERDSRRAALADFVEILRCRL